VQLEEITEHVKTDPELSSEEKEMSIGFSKQSEKATLFTAIASQVRRALTHTDVNVTELYVYNETDETRLRTTTEEFDGEGIVVGLKAKLPIESLKVKSNPRGTRSFGQIISSQSEVNLGDE
jgi:hypothetical protein